MQVPSWEIGRALGIPIRVHASWFVVFLLVTWSLSTGYLPDNLPGLTPERYWAMGGLAAVLLFGSVLLHELGHSYVALYYHIPIEKITLFIFGGVAHMRKEAPTPRAEFLIALAGPAVSFVIGGLCFVFVELAETMQRQHGLQGWIMLGALLGFVNMQLGLFNMIPGFPLDGGRMLRAGLWAWRHDFYRATKQAAGVGLAFGVMLGLAGLVVLYGSASGGLPHVDGIERRVGCRHRHVSLYRSPGESSSSGHASGPGDGPYSGCHDDDGHLDSVALHVGCGGESALPILWLRRFPSVRGWATGGTHHHG